MRFLFLFCVVSLMQVLPVCAQDEEMINTTFHLRFIRLDNSNEYAPPGMPITLTIEENAGSFTSEAIAIANTFNAEANFITDNQLYFNAVSVTLNDCSVAYCDYENDYFYSFLTTNELDPKTFEYDFDTFSGGKKSLRLIDDQNNQAYFTNFPLEINPELFKTWYVVQQEMDLGDPIFFDPSEERSVTINPDFTYSGIDGCRVYNGVITYGEDFVVDFKLLVSDYDSSEEDCQAGDFSFSYDNIGISDGDNAFIDDAGTTLITNMGFGFDVHYTDALLSVEEVEKTNLRLFPNPTQDIVNFDSPTEPVTQIRVLNIQGIELLTQSQSSSMDISSMPAGVYFFQVETLSTKTNFKVIKR